MLKMTKNRYSILQLIENSSVPLSAYDVEKLSKTSLPTVYRALDFLLKAGKIKSFSLHLCNYYYSAAKHRHFFVCSKCNQFFPIHECFMEEYERALQKKMKIEIHEHFVLFTGLCENCLKEKEGERE